MGRAGHGLGFDARKDARRKSIAAPVASRDVTLRLRLALLGPAALAGAWYAGQVPKQAVALKTQAEAGIAPFGSGAAALESLARQPLDAAALRQLALEDGLENASGVQLLQLAAQVSRRDRDTQLYLLEMNAQAGDMPAALRHYDALLSANPQTGPVLLGILARGLNDPALRAALLPYAARSWFPGLVRQATSADLDPQHALALAREAGLLRQASSRNAIAPPLIRALHARGATAAAVGLADELGIAGWQGLGFTAATLDPRLGPLAWKLERSGSGAAQWREPDALAITVAPLRSAIVAQRQTLYTPGSYLLSFALQTVSGGAASELEWALACPGMTPMTVIGEVQAGEGTDRRLTFAVTIPSGCHRQQWRLRALGADTASATTIELSDIDLEQA